MSKQWPKYQTTAPETTLVRHHGVADEVFRRLPTGWRQLSQTELMRLPAVHYTRTDIAEARIAELEGALRKIAVARRLGERND